MEGIITNHSGLKTIDYASLPYLTMDGNKIETTYEPIDSEDDGKLAPGKSAVYSVSYEFDPKEEHEWGFGVHEDTVVDGLDEYACIKEALRDYEGKAPVTMEEIRQMENEQKKKFEEFENSLKDKK